jgi:CHAT domain-containing protein/tetratricopeptide (TPR) repeat protein
MKRMLFALFAALMFAAVVGPARPALAQAGPNSTGTEFSNLLQRFQQSTEIEDKIALGEQLLALESTLTGWPLETKREQVKTEIWFELGNACISRLRGVRADNLERGIALLEKVLGSWSRDADTQNWARVHNNLGIAYWARIRGELSDNQERAIAHFEASLPIFTRAVAPQEWAQLQNNLAVVYVSRIHGERATNLEAAISHFEAALTEFTRETTPLLWAKIQNNLGTVYGRRVIGKRPDNREQAITHLEAALTVFTRETHPNEWASAHNNLASAYLNRVNGDAAGNSEKAITHLQAALEVLTREASPQQWAKIQSLLGNAYSDRVRGERAINRQKAIDAYEAALSVFTSDAFPRDHMLTEQRLGHVLLDAGEWSKAGGVHASARESFLLLFGQGLEETEARSFIADAGPLFAEAAYGAVQRGDIKTAFEWASEGRARLMSVALKLQMLELPAIERQRLDDLRSVIRLAQQIADAAQGTDRASAIDKLIALRQELLSLVKSGSRDNVSPETAMAMASRIADAGNVVVMPVVTKFGGKLLIVAKSAGGTDLTASDLPELTTNNLARLLIGPDDGPPAGWLGAYFINYMDGPDQKKRWPEWLGAIDNLGPELWRLVGARLSAALKGRGVHSGARIIWLPSGWLGTVPLGLALDPISKRRLTDDHEIVYAPSLEALAPTLNNSATSGPASLAVIINPTGDLPGTESEGAIVASYFANNSRSILKGEAATPKDVLAALKGKSHWHFASHGTFSWTDPRQSALIMHNGERLSVGRLHETDGLGHPRLVVLSACETGLFEITNNPDEFIGLPGAFLSLGASGVLGSLWPVSDEATALLMAKFYELHIDARLSPPAALHQAQAWLRNALADDLTTYAKNASGRGRLERQHLAGIERALSKEGLARSRNRAVVQWIARSPTRSTGDTSTRSAKQLVRPYAHPYFWAGFIHTGQ